MIKRWLGMLLVLTMGLNLVGCTSVNNVNQAGLEVICTVFPPYDFVRTVAGDAANVSLLLHPGEECHSFEPTPKDILTIQNCDLFIYVGGESEAWVADMLASMDKPPRTLTLMECVHPVKETLTDGMQGEEEDAYDEHVWTSPKNAIDIVGKLTDVLCELSTADETAFRTAAAQYTEQLQALDTAFSEAVSGGVRRPLVFADRFPFRYLADRYGLSYYAPFPGCAHDAEPSSATVAFLMDTVKKENIPVVFYIEFSNQKLADTLCEGTNAQKRLFHSCHNLTKEEMERGETYLSLMQQNLTVLKEALS